MAAARVALALLLVASAAQTGGAEPCAPRAELGGDAEAVAKVAAELQRLGVDASTDPMKRPARGSCPVIVAAVELDRGGGIAVAVRDSSQRSEGRVVSDAALAAAWIDSWLRDDFTAPPPPPAPLAPPSTVEVTPAPAATPLLDRFSVAASYLLGWSDDSTSWSGVGASLCVSAGGWCIGGRVGYETQTVTANQTAANKSDLSLLATASYPYELGTMSIAPELGVGVGRVSTARVEGCKFMTPNCDPMTDPTCMMMPPEPCTADPGTMYVGDNFSTATYTPRLQAALRIAVPLFDHVWLDGIAAATAAPFGHSDEYAPLPAADGTTMNGAAYPLPGDPMLGVQLGIGLRVGAR
jgi:hypothetical protein